MADPERTDGDMKRFNEVLSPSQLFAARSRSHKIPVRGQKDFFPDESEEQRRRLEQSLDEHWSLISEERVEKLGNLVKATWLPDEQIVELQSPAGKFWQTMGFSAAGKQLLLPEEALYLMECGNLQVFHQDLPLSIQDGYEKFLSSSSISLQQYQVFGHLKRLGYVVHRFDASSESSSYARQLNLPPSRDRAANRLKRKRSVSPDTSSRAEAEDSRRVEDERSHDGEEDKTRPDSPAGDGDGRRTWWRTEVPEERRSVSASSRPDFSSVPFPDVGSRETVAGRLAAPDPALLPGALEVGVCDLGPWRRRINLREVKMSPRDRRREKEEDRRRRKKRWVDREVRRCRNWAEFRELMARRQRRSKGRPEHLWNREVTPLHDPRRPVPTGELQQKIAVIKPTTLLDAPSRLKAAADWTISFSVYQPDTVADFKKSSPGKPYARMCVCSFSGPVPDLQVVQLLSRQSPDVPVVFAVVDHGDVSFYTFRDFTLPVDVQP